MNVLELCERGVREIKGSGTTAAEVAGRLLDDAWAALADEVKRELAHQGLAKVINDEMATERRQKLLEPIRREEEEVERRQAKRRARSETYDRVRQDRASRTEAQRIHEAIGGCARKMCRQTDHLVNCIGGWEVLLMSEEEKAAHIAARVHEREEREADEAKIRRMHDFVMCRRRACDVGSLTAYRHCLRWVLAHPETEQEVALTERRDFNQRLQQEWESDTRWMVQFMTDRTYEQAVQDLRSIMLLASDGSMKPLLLFTRDDVRGWEGRCESNVIAWGERRAWFQAVDQALTEAGVDCVSDLPAEHIRSLAASANLVWKSREAGDPEAEAVA